MAGLVNGLGDRETVFVQNLLQIEIQNHMDNLSSQTFIKAHSFCAARRDMYIHDADFRFPR